MVRHHNDSPGLYAGASDLELFLKGEYHEIEYEG